MMATFNKKPLLSQPQHIITPVKKLYQKPINPPCQNTLETSCNGQSRAAKQVAIMIMFLANGMLSRSCKESANQTSIAKAI